MLNTGKKKKLGAKLGGLTAMILAAVLTATPAAAAGSKYFTDVGTDLSWASASVDRLYESYVVKGSGNGSFLPREAITRGDFALMLVRALKLEGAAGDNFSDVPAGSYYYNAVGVLKSLGVAHGSEGAFFPGDSITRQDAVTLVYRALQAAGLPVSGEAAAALENFSDASQVGDYAREAAEAFVKAGLLQGNGGLLCPLDTMSRAEMAVLLERVLEATGRSAGERTFQRGMDNTTARELGLTAEQSAGLVSMLEFVGGGLIENGFTTIDGSPSLVTATGVLYDMANNGSFPGLTVSGDRAEATEEQLAQMYQSVFAMGELAKDADGKYMLDTSRLGDKITRTDAGESFLLSADKDGTVRLQVYHGETVSTGLKLWCDVYTVPDGGGTPAYWGYALVFLDRNGSWGGGCRVDSYELFQAGKES